MNSFFVPDLWFSPSFKFPLILRISSSFMWQVLGAFKSNSVHPERIKFSNRHFRTVQWVNQKLLVALGDILVVLNIKRTIPNVFSRILTVRKNWRQLSSSCWKKFQLSILQKQLLTVNNVLENRLWHKLSKQARLV